VTTPAMQLGKAPPSGIERLTSRTWRLFLAMGLAGIALYFALPPDAQGILLPASSGIAAGAIAVGIRLHRSRIATAWTLFATGLFFKSSGDLLWHLQGRIPDGPLAGVAAAKSMCYATSYVIIIVALLIVVRRRDPAAFRANVLDALIIGVNAGAISWMFLIGPQVDNEALSSWVAALIALFPVGNVMIFGLLVGLLLSGGRRAIVYLFFTCALLLHVGTDSVNYALSLQQTYAIGGPLDLGWLLAYALVGAGALHPSMTSLSESVPVPRGDRLSTRRLVWFAVAALAGPLGVVIQRLRGEDADVSVSLIGSVVLFLLVLVRLAGLVRDNESKVQLLQVQGRQLREAEDKYRGLVEQVPGVVYTCEPTEDGDWTYVSPQVRTVLGFTPEEVMSNGLWTTQLHPDDRERVLAEEAACREQAQAFKSVYRLLASDGRVVWVRDEAVVVRDEVGRPVVLQGVIHDITEQKLLEEQLHHQAFHDGLTQLANRSLFVDRLQHALVASSRTGARAAVLFLDLDDFKSINDTLGHAVGDQLIRGVADRLRASLRASDTAARLGGDEMAVLLEGCDEKGAERVAEKIVASLESPFTLAGRPVAVRASVGVAVASPGDLAVDELLSKADAAMYATKSRGKGGYHVFEHGMQTDAPAPHERPVARTEIAVGA
jgi:diguanylate cyclase (GGDEF)-like protein/PAS domain S-box-containing protein